MLTTQKNTAIKLIGGYRYSFNGKEKIDEVAGSGNTIDFGARIYDPRVGRFFSIDKFEFNFASESHYSFAGCSPIICKDLEGNFKIVVTEEAKNTKGSEIKIAEFESIVMNLAAYLLENPQVVDEIARQTGYSPEKILSDAKYGEGPTIYIDVNFKGASADYSTYLEGGFSFDYTLVESLGTYSTSEAITKASVNLIFAAVILHEYTHYVDRVTNKGKITGDPNGDDSGPGKQNSTSRFKHRGSDVEFKILNTTISLSENFKYDEEGNTISGGWYFEKSEIDKVKAKVTLLPKEKAETAAADKRTVLPMDQQQ